MSRRRGEFEHRTSIFEGAFRAWSHLGGLEPEDLESKPPAELDPLSNPVQNDSRLTGKKGKDQEGSDALNANGTERRIYPYEPLPRSGLAHPYVQAILSPWLGPDADNDAIQLGLTTLRTWWQHRRKGESGSAVAALGTEKMKGVVEGYTRHFFTLAHCLVMNDKEQPPRSLHGKMKELEKIRSKRNKKRSRDDDPGKVGGMGMAAGDGNLAAGIAADLTNKNLSPLERLHVAQQRKLAVEGGVHSAMQVPDMNPMPPINIKNKCIAGKVDLPGVVDAVNRRANQLAHGGANRTSISSAVPSAVVSSSSGGSQYGDPDTVPIVFVADNGDILVAMSVDGITCAHCVKIVETVLKGCNGNKSPIDGLLDAAADRDLCSVLVKIDKVSAAKRVAFESARNLAMVGYTAKAKVMSSSMEIDGNKTKVPDETIFNAFNVVARSDPRSIFNWIIPCSCPDNGVLRSDCSRHSQMSPAIFDSFENRGMLVRQFIGGAKLDPPPATIQIAQDQEQQMQQRQQRHQPQQLMNDHFQPQPLMQNGMSMNGMAQNAGMEMFGGHNGMGGMNIPQNGVLNDGDFSNQRVQRNPSIVSFGGGRAMSMGEASYGRAMSGLSALSIDWENMDDFDINVDHSAHINNNSMNPNVPLGVGADGMLDPKPIGGGRRSSLRQFMIGGNDTDAHVSFKV